MPRVQQPGRPGDAAVPARAASSCSGSTQRFAPVTLGDEAIRRTVAKPPAAAALRVVRGPQTGMTFTLGDDLALDRPHRRSARCS